MRYSYTTATEEERNEIFKLYRLVMKEYINGIWGWCESWQKEDFTSHYKADEMTLVYKDNKLVGYSQIEDDEELLFVRMLVIHPEHQRNGIGTELLNNFIALAVEKSKTARLEVFKINSKSKKFYETRGFKVKGETEHSYVMEKWPNKSN